MSLIAFSRYGTKRRLVKDSLRELRSSLPQMYAKFSWKLWR